MKLRSRPSQQVTVKNQLKVRLIVIGSALALAAIVGTGIFIWLNIGAPDRAMAASASLNGVINSYLRVNSISSRSFTADNLSGNISDFAAGRTVMIYQVKGASITVSNSASYGTITDLNSAGLYEFAVVSAISGSGPYTITVASLLNSYNASGAVQLISVPTYTDAAVVGTVTATPWDATMGRGGVVAMQVANDLTLGGNISVTGQGFKGGAKGGTSSVCPDDKRYKSPSDDYGAKGKEYPMTVVFMVGRLRLTAGVAVIHTTRAVRAAAIIPMGVMAAWGHTLVHVRSLTPEAWAENKPPIHQHPDVYFSEVAVARGNRIMGSHPAAAMVVVLLLSGQRT